MLPAAELHLWKIDLRRWRARGQELERPLDADERRRARRLHSPRAALDFIVAHGRRRVILGEYLGLDPAALRFKRGAQGKPRLATGESAPPLFFNLSHSGDYALLAIAREREVGVDIEAMNRRRGDLGAIVERFFSPDEIAVWRSLAARERRRAFFLGWTRKEAFLKAHGAGLTRRLDSFTVELRPSAAARLHAVDGDPAAAAAWHLHDLAIASGYAAAVCHSGRPLRPCLREDRASARRWTTARRR